jgi:hypothetical protein
VSAGPDARPKGRRVRRARSQAEPRRVYQQVTLTEAEREQLRARATALFMLAAGQPDSAVGWLLVCRELGVPAGEIGRVHRARGEFDRAREIEAVELDAEAEAANRAREPLGPARRQAPERTAEVDTSRRSSG